MFQFRRFPSYTYLIQYTVLEVYSSGFPHSEIRGSKIICISPRLIAAYHVFLRLPVPRHSPCALFSLTVLYALLILLICQQDQNKIVVNNILLCISFRSYYSVFKVHLRLSPLISKISLLHFRVSTKVVGSSGLEPPTSRLSGARSNHLSYEPIWWR